MRRRGRFGDAFSNQSSCRRCAIWPFKVERLDRGKEERIAPYDRIHPKEACVGAHSRCVPGCSSGSWGHYRGPANTHPPRDNCHCGNAGRSRYRIVRKIGIFPPARLRSDRRVRRLHRAASRRVAGTRRSELEIGGSRERIEIELPVSHPAAEKKPGGVQAKALEGVSEGGVEFFCGGFGPSPCFRFARPPLSVGEKRRRQF